MSSSPEPQLPAGSSQSPALPATPEGQANLLLELCDMVAKNPEAWPELRSKLAAAKEAGEAPALSEESEPAATYQVAARPEPKRRAAPANRPALHIPGSGPGPTPAPVAVEPTEGNRDPVATAAATERPRKHAKAGIWAKIGGRSLMIAVLFHIVLLVIGALWIFQIILPPEKKVNFMPPGGGGGERGAEKVSVKKLKQITPPRDVRRVFAENAISTYSIPKQGDNFGEMSALSSLSGGATAGLGGSGTGEGFGKGDGKGNGLGTGAGAGKLFGLIPDIMRKRCSKEDRLQRLKANGGTPECEEAVMKSLRWLKGIQNADGSWGQDVDREYTGRIGMTSLVLLAYLGHCETPLSDEFGESCMRGIVFLVDRGMKNQGKLATSLANDHWGYEHSLGAYALGEASTFCKDLKISVPNLNEITQQAGQFIIDNQNKSGGWAYSYATDGGHTDVSLSGWQLQALKACSHNNALRFTGLQSCIGRGLRYLGTCQAAHGGYGYSGPTSGHPPYFTLTGVGTLCNQMWGKGKERDTSKGIQYITENSKFDYASPESNLYQHYYESQAMMQAGGEAWTHYNSIFRDQILRNQNPDGTWKPPGSGGHPYLYGTTSQNGNIYRNCLCTLMLEVYYRFLATGGGIIRDI